MKELRIARQGGWVGLVVVLVALVIVAVLAKDALKKYGLMPGAAAPHCPETDATRVGCLRTVRRRM